MFSILKKKFTFGQNTRGVHVDETLTGFDRFVTLYESEDSLQRQACTREIVECAFQAGFAATRRNILPRITDLLNDDDGQVRSASLSVLSDFSGYLIQSEYEEGYVD
jgi:hypothetical protein